MDINKYNNNLYVINIIMLIIFIDIILIIRMIIIFVPGQNQLIYLNFFHK